MTEWVDRSILEAASWRLASELVRRHPQSTRLIRAFPGDGQYDVLWILASACATRPRPARGSPGSRMSAPA